MGPGDCVTGPIKIGLGLGTFNKIEKSKSIPEYLCFGDCF